MENKKNALPVVKVVLSAAILLLIFLLAIFPAHKNIADENITETAAVPTEEVAPLPAEEAPEEISVTEFGSTLQALLDDIAGQAELEEAILAELAGGAYTFEAPLVVVDPYDASPLTAIVVFQTDAPVQASIHIAGKTPRAEVDFTVPDWKTEHFIPVYGLYENSENTVDLTIKEAAGASKTISLAVQTANLSPAHYRFIPQIYCPNPKAVQDGFNFTYSEKMAFDINGDIRWANDKWCNQQSTLYGYGEGTYITAHGATLKGDLLIVERNFLGKILTVLYSPYGVHHDIEATDYGTILLTGSNGSTVEDFIYEVDMETGQTINTMDLKTVLPRISDRNVLTENDWFQFAPHVGEVTVKDWLHNNAIVWDDGSIILSNRHNSSVVKMAWPSGDIEWILASRHGWLPVYEQRLLAVVGDAAAFEWPSYQHAPEILPDMDNDPDTIDLLLFDNGTHRYSEDAELQRQLRANEIVPPENYSRMVHYRINEKEMTIEQIWEYGKERGEALFALRCGSANLLTNGNRLGHFLVDEIFGENILRFTIVTEVSENGSLVWEALMTGKDGDYVNYRTERLPLYHASDNDLRIGAPVVNLIPRETMEANGILR